MDELPDHALVLVAVLPSRRDFEIARLLGWYRIPLKTAPKVIQVDYLAFYQTASFGKDHQWRIEQVARVRGHELTTRLELLRDEPDHPRAQEEYFKIQIGPLERLRKPILAGGWKRLTFLYTTGEQIKRAATLKDLVVKNEERQVLWHALRDRAIHSGIYKPDELPEFDLDESILLLLGGAEL
jgi:hypothetical protein